MAWSEGRPWSLSRRDRAQTSEWPTRWGGRDVAWPEPPAPVPIDPLAHGVALICWRLPRGCGAATNRITRWPSIDTAVPCPCGPHCEGKHALVFADHGRVRVRSVHEPPTPDLADELRQLYPPLGPRKGRPKSTLAGGLMPAATPSYPRPRSEAKGELQLEDSPSHTPQDWRQRWACKPLMTTG
jgi:hypothetical protein